MSSHDQIKEAYRRMATEARYRPAAPSDGMRNITVPIAELDLDAEMERYAHDWTEQEDAAEFHVGTCNYSTRPATIFAIEAARLMCGAGDEFAARLLRMALADLDKFIEDESA